MPQLNLYLEDCKAFLARSEDLLVDSYVTSIPYNKGVAYDGYNDRQERLSYLWDMHVVASQAMLRSHRNTVFWLQMGPNREDPSLPFDVLEKFFLSGWRLVNQIVWVKSGTFPQQDGSEASFGHFRPIKSPTILHSCWEWVFMLVRADKNHVKLDKLALGTPYKDACLSVYTELLAKVNGKLRLTQLGRLKQSFDRGDCVELPSFDFERKLHTWTAVTGMTEPYLADVKRVKARSGAQVTCTKEHRFPVCVKNTREKTETLRICSVEAIENRAAAWNSSAANRSKACPLFQAHDWSQLWPDQQPGSFYDYDCGRAIGLYLAEGSEVKGQPAFSYAGHQKEITDPEFGEFLSKFFKARFGVRVKSYPSKTSKGVTFHVRCAPFKAVLSELVSGRTSHDKHLNWEAFLKKGPELLRGVIDGFLKGDGHWVKAHDYHQVALTENRRLVEDLRTACLLVGYEFKQTADKPPRRGPAGKKGAKTQVAFWVRKRPLGGRKKAKELGLSVTGLDSVENVATNTGKSESMVIDLEVAADHHLFFLANGLMTHNSNVKRFNHSQNLRCRGDLWFVPYETTQKSSHPCPFPVALAENCLKLQGISPRSLVMDPFCGTGATLEAAGRLGHNAIGCDLSGKYITEAYLRLLERGFEAKAHR